MEIQKNKIFVQIGTNNGHDEFNEMVRKLEPSMVILVEPNKLLNDTIHRNYSNIDNVFLENVAITEENKGKVKLFLPKDVPGKSASVNGVHYGDPGFSLLPMNDWGDDFEIIEADSMTVNELCEKYHINNIHFLQIDTEGYDSEIIKSIDFNKVSVDIIKYERWTFLEEAFTRHGEKCKLYGMNGMNYVSNLLESLDYTVTTLPYDMLATKNNIISEAEV